MTRRVKNLAQDDFLRLELPREFWGANCKQIPPSVQGPVNNFLRMMETMKNEGAGLLLMGGPGVGKTTVASLVLKRGRELGWSGLFSSVSHLREDLRGRREFDGDRTMLARCREVDVLVLDDLSMADARDMWFGARHVEELLAARKAARLITVITTRMSKDAMRGEPNMNSLLATATGSLIDILITGRNYQEIQAARLRGLVGARDVEA